MAGGTGRRIIAAFTNYRMTMDEAKKEAAVYKPRAESYVGRMKELGGADHRDVIQTEKLLRKLKRIGFLK